MPVSRSKSLYHRSKRDKSRCNRTRVYSFGSVIHDSIADREAKSGLATEGSSHALCRLGIDDTDRGHRRHPIMVVEPAPARLRVARPATARVDADTSRNDFSDVS